MKHRRSDTTHLYFADDFGFEKAKHLYKLLKRELYYETTNIYARLAIAEFEKNKLEQKIAAFTKVINSKSPARNSLFGQWLKSIRFNLLPKKIVLPSETESDDKSESGKTFISNLRADDRYFLEEVNYFIDVPLELLLLSMLWSVTVGVLLDKKVGAHCLGNRLDLRKDEGFNEDSFRSFKYYLPNYNNWRDKAIKAGLENLEAGNDILLIAMDIKQCFYFIKTHWSEIHEVINHALIPPEEKQFCTKLTELLFAIHARYFEITENFLSITRYHSKAVRDTRNLGLPIGLPSSRILANWELSNLDQSIIKKLRPIYYGRYVDDFLIVLNNPGRELLSPSSIIDKFFIRTNILKNGSAESGGSNGAYQIRADNLDDLRYEHLEIQRRKLIFHFYAHEGSWAGLTEFRRELNKQASEFRFLPVQGELSEFMDNAYDINFEGSVNKLRSVIGVKENSIKLSNQLFARILKYWLGNRKLEKKELEKLFRFYQGRNIFEYARTWARVLTLFIGTNQLQHAARYYKDVLEVLNKLQSYQAVIGGIRSTLITDKKIVAQARQDIIEYLNISLASALSFESAKNLKEFSSKNGWVDNRIFGWARSFRTSHMIRHELVRWPLLEYVDLNNNLITFDLSSDPKQQKWSWSRSSFEYAPRHISYHEFALLYYLKELRSSKHIADAKQILSEYKAFFGFEENTLKIQNGRENVNEIHLFDTSKNRKEPFYIGVANLNVLEKNFRASYQSNMQPNLSLERQDDLFQIINEAIRHPKCDLVVLPEVSIPYMWLPFMASTSKKHKIGLIFGLEHLTIKNLDYNLVVTILPFQDEKSAVNCFISIRTKNHYSPEEKIDLESYGLKIPESKLYEKFFWRNCWFSVYNCFELTDLEARGIFRSELDLLVSIVWNKDVNYYSNIIESISRDLHLYIVQANTSNYGDSRIVAPKKTEEKDIIRVKGGLNPLLLKGLIDIDELRDFQNRFYTQNDERFKPTPAGFRHKGARLRSKNTRH